MDDFTQQIASAAENAVALCEYHCAAALDYSEASLQFVERTLAEADRWAGELTAEQLKTEIESVGCYILEVGRREFGGRYLWHDERNQPILVVGEPTRRIALLAQDKVRGRLGGDAGDNIPFFYAGFVDRARSAQPGTDVLYV